MAGKSNPAFAEENELHPVNVNEDVKNNRPATIQLQSNEYPTYQQKNEEEMLK